MMVFNDQQFLKQLAEREIDRIKRMCVPVVRVCGPLTCDGPEGYERNAARLEMAEQILEARGCTVWKFGESERFIQGRNFSHDDIVAYFHEYVLSSGSIQEAYFLPRWEQSRGARREREFCEKIGIKIQEFEERWFQSL